MHDVTSTPFPTGAADLVYARLVLAHLADPGAVVRSWCTQIAPNGVVLLDDLETIDVEDGVVCDYLEEVALAVVRRAGGALFVGPALHAMPDPAGALRIHDDVATVAPSPSVTARIFGMNLQVLVARGEVPARPEVAEGLAAIADGTRASGPVTWRMRQVAFRIG